MAWLTSLLHGWFRLQQYFCWTLIYHRKSTSKMKFLFSFVSLSLSLSRGISVGFWTNQRRPRVRSSPPVSGWKAPRSEVAQKTGVLEFSLSICYYSKVLWEAERKFTSCSWACRARRWQCGPSAAWGAWACSARSRSSWRDGPSGPSRWPSQWRPRRRRCRRRPMPRTTC